MIMYTPVFNSNFKYKIISLDAIHWFFFGFNFNTLNCIEVQIFLVLFSFQVLCKLLSSRLPALLTL